MLTERDAIHGTESQGLSENSNALVESRKNYHRSHTKRDKESKKQVRRTIPRAPHRQIFLTNTSQLLPFHVLKRGRQALQSAPHHWHGTDVSLPQDGTAHFSHLSRDASISRSSGRGPSRDALRHQDLSGVVHSNLSRSQRVHALENSDVLVPRDSWQSGQSHQQRSQNATQQTQWQENEAALAKPQNGKHIHTDRFFYVSEPVELQIESMSGPCVHFMLFLWYFILILCVATDMFPQLRWEMLNICDSKKVSLSNLNQKNSPCFQNQPSLSKPGHFNVTWIANLQEDLITPYFMLRHIVVSTRRPSMQSSAVVDYSEPIEVITGTAQGLAVAGPVDASFRCMKKNSLCDVLKLSGGVKFPFRGLSFPELSSELMSAMTGGPGKADSPAFVGVIFEKKTYTIVAAVCRYSFIAFSFLHMLRFIVYRKYTSHLYEQTWIIALQIFLICYLNPLFIENLSTYPFSGILRFIDICLPTCFVAMNLGFMYSVMTASMLWQQRTDVHRVDYGNTMTLNDEEENLDFDGTVRTRSWGANIFNFLFRSKNLYDPPFWTKALVIIYVLFALGYQIARSLGDPDYSFAGISFDIKLSSINWDIIVLVLGCLICFGLLIYLNNFLGKKPYLESRPQQLVCCMFLMIFLFIILYYIVNFITLYVYISQRYPVTNPQYPFTHLTSLALNTLFVNIMTFVYTTQHRDDNVPIHPNDRRWMLMVWPPTWHTWLSRHGGSQYIFFTEHEETNFYTLQLDFHKRQLMARLKRKNEYNTEAERDRDFAQTNLAMTSPVGRYSQAKQWNRSDNIASGRGPADPYSYTEEVKQNEHALPISRAPMKATLRGSRACQSKKEHLPDPDTVTVAIHSQDSLDNNKGGSTKLIDNALKDKKEHLPYGVSSSTKNFQKQHSRVAYVGEDADHRSGVCEGSMKRTLNCMDRFSSSFLPEIPDNSHLARGRLWRQTEQDDKATFLQTCAETARIVEPQTSSLLSPGLVFGVEGPAKHSARLEASTQRAITRTSTVLTARQPHCSRLVLITPKSDGTEIPLSSRLHTPRLSLTSGDESSIRSVALAMRTLLRSGTSTHVSDSTPVRLTASSHECRGAHKRERSGEYDTAPLPSSELRQPVSFYTAHTPREVPLSRTSEGGGSHISHENHFSFRKAINKAHIGINRLVDAAERNLFTRPMRRIEQLQKKVMDAFYRPFENTNYLPFFNLETAVDCFNLSWEVYNVEENSNNEYVEVNIGLGPSNMFQRVVFFLRSCFCCSCATKDASEKGNIHSGCSNASGDPGYSTDGINRADNDQIGSELAGKQPVQGKEGRPVHVDVAVSTVVNPTHPEERKKSLLAHQIQLKYSVNEKIRSENDDNVGCLNESDAATTTPEVHDVNPQSQSEVFMEEMKGSGHSSHCAHHATKEIEHGQPAPPAASCKPQIPAQVLPINVNKYGYKPILVTQIKEVQVLIAQIDTNAREHLYKAPRIVIAFRGTANWSNAKDDMNVKRVEWNEMMEDIKSMGACADRDSFMAKLSNKAFMGCNFYRRLWRPTCHGGFLTIWKAMRTVLIQNLLEVLQGDPDTVYRVFTTGHSLGGALASFCAYSVTRELHRIRYPIPEVTVYSYGTPRIGNMVFCQIYNRVVPRTFHVTNESDMVATMGLFCNYHVGIEVKIDRNGNYIVKPTDIEKIFPPTKGTGLAVMNHLMVAYGASLNTIARRTQCLARCWEPYLIDAPDTTLKDE